MNPLLRILGGIAIPCTSIEDYNFLIRLLIKGGARFPRNKERAKFDPSFSYKKKNYYGVSNGEIVRFNMLVEPERVFTLDKLRLLVLTSIDWTEHYQNNHIENTISCDPVFVGSDFSVPMERKLQKGKTTMCEGITNDL